MKKKLEFTEKELNIILYALQKQPYDIVNVLIDNIVEQLKATTIKK
jgi:hypothetical protein